MEVAEVTLKDNSQALLKARDDAIARALEAIGLTAERHAKEQCPVNTGRLRNSITHYVAESEKAVYIGTNVEYGKYVETIETRRHPSGKAHFLRDAAANHGAEYKRITETHLKS